MGNQATTLNLKDAEALVRAAIVADIPLMIEGDPGVGKTAMILRVGTSLGLPVYILQLGEVQEVDVGGFPVVTDNRVMRLPLGPIHAATLGPCVLFLDDFRTATPPVQGTALRLLQGKAAGDIQLHPGCRVILAANPVEQTPGGSPLSAPVINRMCVVRMRPDVAEIAPFFENLGDPAGDAQSAALRDLGVDLAATLDRQPDLLEIEPSPAAINNEAPWASPRGWEKGLRMCAALTVAGVPDTSPVFRAALSGAIGETQAIAFLGIRKVRKDLPSVAEIVDDPTSAKLPTNPGTYIAILGVVVQVALRNASAAHAYAERLGSEEIKLVLARRLLQYGASMTHKQKHYQIGSKARVKLQGLVSMAKSDTLE